MAPGYIFERGRAGGTSQGIAVIARHRVILTSEIKNRDFPGPKRGLLATRKAEPGLRGEAVSSGA
jgi:hypothetical protein